MYRIEIDEKKAIALAFFSCGCNQSQIFPRSGCKGNILCEIKKRVFGIYLKGDGVDLFFYFCDNNHPHPACRAPARPTPP